MNRKIQPEIQTLKDFRILPPVRTTLPNGIPLTVINAGEQDVVRMDILFGGGRWQQSQKLQALFTNRMLREGTKKNIRLPQLPENWTIMVHGWNYPVLRTMLTLLFIH